MGEIKEQWHPPFYCSYEIDFRKYKDMLQIDTGYILERSSEIDILTVKNMEEYRERILEVIRFITKQYDDKKKGKEAIKKMDVIEELINEKIEEKDKEIESWKEQAQKNARRAEAAEAIIEQLKSRGVSIDGEQVAL